MIAVVLVIIGIVAAFALGIIAALAYMGDDEEMKWEEENRHERR